MSVVPESIEYHIGNLDPALLMSWLVWLIIGAGSFIVLTTLRRVPSPLQSLFELVFEKVTGLVDDAIGPDAGRYYPLFIGIFLYILVGNILGLIPGFISPTSSLNVTVALALVVFLYINYVGFSKHGLGYIRNFMGPPMPWYMFPVTILMFLIEVISHFSKPFSLAMRLFCNIFAKEMLLGILAFLVIQFMFGQDIAVKIMTFAPLFLRPVIILLGLLVGFIQALIFLVLSISYVAGAVQTEHAKEHVPA